MRAGPGAQWGPRPGHGGLTWVLRVKRSVASSSCSVHKTEEELQAILAAKEEKLRLKAQRQDQQAQNVRRKREQREAHKYVVTRQLRRGPRCKLPR